MGEPDHKTGEPGGHAEILYEDVRVPYENMVGNAGRRASRWPRSGSGPGRIHHAMRWLGQSQRAFDMLCERALSRYTHGSLLAEKQMIQDWIAEQLRRDAGGPAAHAAGGVEDGPAHGGRTTRGPGRDRA